MLEVKHYEISYDELKEIAAQKLGIDTSLISSIDPGSVGYKITVKQII